MTVNKFLPMDLQMFSDPETEPVPPSVEELEVELAEPQSEPEPAEPENKPVVDNTAADAALKLLQEKVQQLEAEKAATESKLAADSEQAKKAQEQMQSYEAALSQVVEGKLGAIPDGIKALMPEGLSVADKLAWVEKAEAAVPPVEPEQPKPEVQIETIGQPTPVPTENTVDPSKLSASQKLSHYFSEFFSGDK